ncbi:MAG TPA: hypothetical protein VGD59_03730 [Acidisarcina sp.]
MSYMPILWIIWAAVAAVLFIMLIYRGRLTRYEGDQLFLDESSHQHELEQAEIVSRVNRLQPFLRTATGITCLLSAVILGTYVWDAVKQFTM